MRRFRAPKHILSGPTSSPAQRASAKPHYWHLLLVTTGSLLNSGCFDGSDPAEASSGQPLFEYTPPCEVDSNGEGVYVGTITSDVTAGTQPFFALVDGWGFTKLIGPSGQYYGRPPDELAGLTTAGNTWLDGSTHAEFVFAGSLRAGSGSYSGAGDAGTWTLNQQPKRAGGLYDGVYALRDDNQNIRASFQVTNGSGLYGSNVDGCIFTGEFSQDGWDFHYVYDVILTVENCPDGVDEDLDGNYFGLGGFTDTAGCPAQSRSFLIAVNNEEQAVTLALERL